MQASDIAGMWAKYSAPLSALGNPVMSTRINIQDQSGAVQPVHCVDKGEVLSK